MSKELNYEEDTWNILNAGEKGCMDYVKLKKELNNYFREKIKYGYLK